MLDNSIEWRGKPESIRCGNGPEYISEVLKQWAGDRQIEIEYTHPGRPEQNVYVERFNRTVRYDWLAHHLVESIAEVQEFASDCSGITTFSVLTSGLPCSTACVRIQYAHPACKRPPT